MADPRLEISYLSEESIAIWPEDRERIINFGKKTATVSRRPPRKTKVRWTSEDFRISGEVLGRLGTGKDFQEGVWKIKVSIGTENVHGVFSRLGDDPSETGAIHLLTGYKRPSFIVNLNLVLTAILDIFSFSCYYYQMILYKNTNLRSIG